eukprot:199771_1
MGNCNPSRCGKNMIEYGEPYTKKRVTSADNTEHIPKHLSHLAPMDFKTMELLLQFDTITVSPTSVTNVSFTPVIIPVIDQSNIDPKNTDDIPNGSTQHAIMIQTLIYIEQAHQTHGIQMTWRIYIMKCHVNSLI